MYSLLITFATTTSTTVASSSKKSSSAWPLLIIILLFVAAYVFFIRPRQQRIRQQHTQARQLAIGDSVVSVGGIHGKVVAIDSDVAEVEVSPGVVLTFLRRAINPVPGSTAPPEPEDDKWEVTQSDRGRAADLEAPGFEESGHPESNPPDAGSGPEPKSDPDDTAT